MCGIAGFVDLERRSGTQELEAFGRAMAATLAHRGPDASGVWSDAEAGIVLGHTRLAIVDLSPAGAQPMASSCGRCVIAYNGEIYNASSLRPELEARGRRFTGHSDTEVLVEAIAEWGVEPTVKRLIGMFAFAVWDRRARSLTLVRDRLGIKPLYFGKQNGRLVFASELKAFETLPGWRPELDHAALASFMRLSYVPAPHSIYRDIAKLEPGQIATVDAEGRVSISRYWCLDEIAERGRAAPLDLDDRQAIDMFETLLGDAVGRRLVADVPLGAFLSGGIDSSLVAAMMRARSNAPVRTYSIGFKEEGYDEAPQARAVAAHLGTDHTELYVSPSEAQAVIPDLPTIYDEPFADSSQVPTYLLSKLTRGHVTVALSGDGGDELFAGYTRHHFARVAGRLPDSLSYALACGLGVAGPALWDHVLRVLPASRRPRLGGDKLMKAASMFRAGGGNGYLSLVSAWDRPEDIVRGAKEVRTPIFDPSLAAAFADPLDRMQYLDTLTYLPDDILTKVDRASMAVALEVRVPLIDHRLVEFAWKMPALLKLRGTMGKWLLRQAL
jgi:asparagine synthase (glutamine-hydrolysing)